MVAAGAAANAAAAEDGTVGVTEDEVDTCVTPLQDSDCMLCCCGGDETCPDKCCFCMCA